MSFGPGLPSQPAIQRTPGPGNIPSVLGEPVGMNLSPDPAGGRMALRLPAQPQSWGLQNPALPSQLDTYLRNYSGGVNSLDEALLAGLVQSAKTGDPWNTSSGHGNAGLPDGGANLPADATLAGMGNGPARVGGSDLSESDPASWFGTGGLR